jgi:hypothetical protein
MFHQHPRGSTPSCSRDDTKKNRLAAARATKRSPRVVTAAVLWRSREAGCGRSAARTAGDALCRTHSGSRSPSGDAPPPAPGDTRLERGARGLEGFPGPSQGLPLRLARMEGDPHSMTREFGGKTPSEVARTSIPGPTSHSGPSPGRGTSTTAAMLSLMAMAGPDSRQCCRAQYFQIVEKGRIAH